MPMRNLCNADFSIRLVIVSGQINTTSDLSSALYMRLASCTAYPDRNPISLFRYLRQEPR